MGTWGRGHRGAAEAGELPEDHPGRPSREPRPRRDHHQGSPELPGGVAHWTKDPHPGLRVAIHDAHRAARAEQRVYSEIHPFNVGRSSCATSRGRDHPLRRAVQRVRRRRAADLEGGGRSGHPRAGICYGMQLLADLLGARSGARTTGSTGRQHPRAMGSPSSSDRGVPPRHGDPGLDEPRGPDRRAARGFTSIARRGARRSPRCRISRDDLRRAVPPEVVHTRGDGDPRQLPVPRLRPFPNWTMHSSSIAA